MRNYIDTIARITGMDTDAVARVVSGRKPRSDKDAATLIAHVRREHHAGEYGHAELAALAEATETLRERERAVEEARKVRNSCILTARRAGALQDAIAREAGLDVSMVRRILREMGA